MADAKKSKIFTGSLYPDAENYDCAKVLETVKAKFKQWAFAAHDSDVNDDGELKKLHIHWVGRGDPALFPQLRNFLGFLNMTLKLAVISSPLFSILSIKMTLINSSTTQLLLRQTLKILALCSVISPRVSL